MSGGVILASWTAVAGLCLAALWTAARYRRDVPLYVVSTVALLAWMGASVAHADLSAILNLQLFGGILAVVHGWFVATLALSGEPDATSRNRFLFALAFGVALGLFYPCTQGWMAERFAQAGERFSISHTRFYPWGCLGYFLYGLAALLLFRVAWRWARRRVRIPAPVAVAAAWGTLCGLQFLPRLLGRIAGVPDGVCRRLPFNLEGLDVCAPYHVAVASGLLLFLSFLLAVQAKVPRLRPAGA